MNAKALSMVITSFCLSSAASASFETRLGGMVYDTERNITWITNANFFKTQADSNPNLVNDIIAAVPRVYDTPNGFDTPPNSGYYDISASDFDTSTGKMTWFGAMAWTENLTYGGFSDWRIPSALTPSGFCTGYYSECNSELTSLFASPSEFANFSNIQRYYYYSNTEYGDSRPIYIVNSQEGEGFGWQSGFWKNDPAFALAVRTGDVAAVPIPAAVWLFNSALAGIGFVGKRRIKKKSASQETLPTT